MKTRIVKVFSILCVFLVVSCEIDYDYSELYGWRSEQYWTWDSTHVLADNNNGVFTVFDTIYALSDEEYGIYFDYNDVYLMLNRRVIFYSYEPMVIRGKDYFSFKRIPTIFEENSSSAFTIWSFPLNRNLISSYYSNLDSTSLNVKNYFSYKSVSPWE
jgi:hypothetical protein